MVPLTEVSRPRDADPGRDELVDLGRRRFGEVSDNRMCHDAVVSASPVDNSDLAGLGRRVLTDRLRPWPLDPRPGLAANRFTHPGVDT
jgi:hypothetical protein